MAFLTTDANALVAPVHPKVIPVIVHPEDYEEWLAGDGKQAQLLAAPFPSQFMRVEQG